MGILDGIVAWIAEQVMNGLDLITTSVLGALGCDMSVFLRYFPAAETMYQVFVALGVGLSNRDYYPHYQAELVIGTGLSQHWHGFAMFK